MLIELRSSPADPNNTPNQLFQLFKETLILKPKTRIALVSALITTNKTDAFIITAENRTFSVEIAGWGVVNITIDMGDYQGQALANEIQNKARTAIEGINTDLQGLFFPVADIMMTKDSTGFQFQIGYVPVGFTSVAPTETTNENTSIQLTASSYRNFNKVLSRSRDNASTFNESTSSALAVNPILPYANTSASKNFNGDFTVSGLTPYSRGNYIGLEASEGTPTGNFIMDSVNGYENGLNKHNWDKFDTTDIPTGEPNYAYDWVVRKSGSGGGGGYSQLPQGNAWTQSGTGTPSNFDEQNLGIATYRRVSGTTIHWWEAQYGSATGWNIYITGPPTAGQAPDSTAQIDNTTGVINEASGATFTPTTVPLLANTFYGKFLATNNFIGVNYSYTTITNAYDDIYEITLDSQGKGNGYVDGLGDKLTPQTTGQEIIRKSDSTYAIVERQNGDYDVLHNGTSLATGGNLTKIKEGDSIRWLVNALDSSTDGDHFPQPQLKRLGGAQGFRNFIIDNDKSIPTYDKDTQLFPVVRMDGTLASGCVGSGGITDTQASTSFLASDMTIGNKSSTNAWVAGEILYQVGATTPAGGTGMSLLAVSGTSPIGFTGNLTSVLVMGDGREGLNYAQNMVLSMKGAVSGATCDITLTAVASANTTKTLSGTGYNTTDEYTFSLITASSPTQPPRPFQQNGRLTRAGKLTVGVIAGGGIIGAYTIIDPGHGFVIGDEVRINGGNNDATLTINQVSEDIHQVVLDNMDTRKCPTQWKPLEPQNSGIIDFTANGVSDLGTELNLKPLQYSGILINSTQIQSSSNPAHNNTSNENIMIDLPQIPVGSRNAIGNTDNHIATIPYTTDLDNVLESHKQHYEPYNMIYHELNNEADLNLNHIECRLTNFDGTIRTDLKHPTQLTFSLTPDYK